MFLALIGIDDPTALVEIKSLEPRSPILARSNRIGLDRPQEVQLPSERVGNQNHEEEKSYGTVANSLEITVRKKIASSAQILCLSNTSLVGPQPQHAHMKCKSVKDV
jgi:hypothetical protein